MSRPTKQELIDYINRDRVVVFAGPETHSYRTLAMMAHSRHLQEGGLCTDPLYCIVCKERIPGGPWAFTDVTLKIRHDLVMAAQSRADEDRVSLDLWLANLIRKACA